MKRLIVRWQCAVLLAALPAAFGCGGVAPHARESTRASVEAERLIANMTKRYLSCRSYEDSGNVTVILTSKNSTRRFSSRGEFATGFDRVTGGFTFEYKDVTGGNTEGRVWRQSLTTHPPAAAGSSWQGWLRLNAEVAQQRDLADAIQTFSGISHETSRLVPSMLLGLQESFRQPSLQLRGKELVGGVPCFHLVAEGNDLMSVWIGESDYSLRKVMKRQTLQATPDDIQTALALMPPGLSDEERTKLVHNRSEPFVCETTIEYVPSFDRRMESSRFESRTSSTASEPGVPHHRPPPREAPVE
jgi:hypothetical protein